MRVTVNDSPGMSSGGENQFDQFAYHEDDVRLPSRDFMKEAKKLPVSKVNSNNNKRRIVVSDEDDDDGWMDSRDAKNISEQERERNKKIAMAQRKAVSQSKAHTQIKKAPRTKYAEDNGDSEIEIVDSPPSKRTNLKKVLAKSNLIASSLLQNADSEESELDPVEEVRRFKLKEKEDNRAKRAANRGTAGAAKKNKKLWSSEEEEANDSETEEDSDEDEEDDDEMRWRDNLGQGELREKAHAVLRHCDSVSLNLRLSLAEWQQSSSKGGAAGGGASEEKDCVDLIAINEKSSSSSSSGSGSAGQILHNEDIEVLCPDLRLKAYQLVGVNWMKLLHENSVNGVLADDMGLGKTVQTIAFLAWLKSTANEGKKTRPHIIVVPASTLANWQNELRRFCPALNVITYHGSQTERSNLRQELRVSIADGDVDVILSTYTIFERESGKSDRAFLCAQSFDYMILDEAHCIKNADSSRFMNLNTMKTRHRLLLSGTPVQNDLGELLAMLSFLMPGVFGRDNCELLMNAFGFSRGSTTSSNGNVTLQQLRGMLVPFVLRRLKRDVLDQLTEKTNRMEKLGMTDFQRKVYDSVLLGHTVKRDRAKAASDERERELYSLDDVKQQQQQQGVKKSGSSVSIKDNTSSKSSSNKEAASGGGGRLKKKSALTQGLIDLTSPVAAAPVRKNESMSDMASTVGEVLVDLTADDANSTVDLNVLDTEEVKTSVLTSESVTSAVNEMSASEANHLFTALRKAANHPLLLRVRYKEESVMDRIATVAYHQEHFGNQCDFSRVRAELDKYSDFDLHLICMEYPDLLSGYELEASVLYDSPKMKKLREMLPALQEEGHRMLIFSQWTRLLDLLGVLLEAMNMPFLRLDGSTPIKERQELIDTYNTDKSIPVFLLSTKAGGLGINLTAADTVIMHDLDFNPENDRQAEDRCHRIGQTRPVTVYKLVTEGTVDELIYEMGERKRQLSQAVLSDERKAKTTGRSPAGKGGSGGPAGNDESDENAISRMLQRALAQRAQLAIAVENFDAVPVTVSPDSEE